MSAKQKFKVNVRWDDTYMDSLGWRYKGKPEEGTDARKLVSLTDDGMAWVGIRVWNGRERCWYNGNEPERARVLAWQDLPATARRMWIRGQLSKEIKESTRE